MPEEATPQANPSISDLDAAIHPDHLEACTRLGKRDG
jgi:hypothetical protein